VHHFTQGQAITKTAGIFIVAVIYLTYNNENAKKANHLQLYFAGVTKCLKETLAMNETIKYQKRHIS